MYHLNDFWGLNNDALLSSLSRAADVSMECVYWRVSPTVVSVMKDIRVSIAIGDRSL